MEVTTVRVSCTSNVLCTSSCVSAYLEYKEELKEQQCEDIRENCYCNNDDEIPYPTQWYQVQDYQSLICLRLLLSKCQSGKSHYMQDIIYTTKIAKKKKIIICIIF